MDITYHFPPDLMGLLIDAIPALCKSKRDVLLFFRGAGVSDDYTRDIAARLATDPNAVRKHETVRTVLARLNEKGEAALRERREVLRRVVEVEDFSMCWDNDRHKAMALVGQIRHLVNRKDSFTRMRDVAEAERQLRQQDADARTRARQERAKELAGIKADLFALFGASNPWKRGKALEGVLNRLFKVHGIGVREAFTVRGNDGEGVIEQIDGAIELDGHFYLVEMKWWNAALGPGEVAQALVRAFSRDGARALIIGYPSFTPAAVASCRDALAHKVVVLCELEEIVKLLDNEHDLRVLLKRKVEVALAEKRPLFKP